MFLKEELMLNFHQFSTHIVNNRKPGTCNKEQVKFINFIYIYSKTLNLIICN